MEIILFQLMNKCEKNAENGSYKNKENDQERVVKEGLNCSPAVIFIGLR
jgi:hypothetical protein